MKHPIVEVLLFLSPTFCELAESAAQGAAEIQSSQDDKTWLKLLANLVETVMIHLTKVWDFEAMVMK